MTFSPGKKIKGGAFRPPDMARFSNRNIRLSRQRENSVCRCYLMPVSGMIGLVGVLAMLAVLLDYQLNHRWEATAFTLGAIAASLPVLLFLYRWCRGHFNRQLERP
ncbi:MAG: hypothetical protein ACO3PN_11010 [Chthoniobacterales bacterium]